MLGSKQGAVRIKDKMNKAAEQLAAFPYSRVILNTKKIKEKICAEIHIFEIVGLIFSKF